MQVPGAAPRHQALGNTAQKGLGRAEKGRLEEKGTLTTEHTLGLFKSKTTVAPKAGAFYSPGGEKQLCISPPHICGKVQRGLWLFCWDVLRGSAAAQSNTCSGIHRSSSFFGFFFCYNYGNNFWQGVTEFLFLSYWHPSLWLTLARGLSSSRGSHQTLTVSQGLWA